MADSYVNATGIAVIKQWAEGLFALDSDLSTLSARVDAIVATGGEPNVIEIVKKNGTPISPDANKAVDISVPVKTSDITNDGDGSSNFATEQYVQNNGGKIDKIQKNGTDLTITNKTVNIPIPVKLSELTNDGDGTTGSQFATKSYVDANGGKIDVIKKNGVAQTITNKEVNISVPTKTSDLTNDDGFQDATDVETAINAKLASVYKPKGSIAFANLPALQSSNEGFVCDINEAFTTTSDFVEGAGKHYPSGTNVVIINNGTSSTPVYKYDVLSGVTDLSSYWTSETGKSNTLVAMTSAEILAILNA